MTKGDDEVTKGRWEGYEKRPIRTEGSRPTNPRNQIDSFFHLRILSHKTSYFLLLFSGSLHNYY